MERIDSHQHFWRYSAEEYDWIDESMAEIRRDFLPQDLEAELLQTGIAGSVAVQARQTLEETRWLLELAQRNSFVRGVVGWVQLASPNVGDQLEAFSSSGLLKGVRHVVQGEPDERFMLGSDFNRGISQLLEFNLAYDILIFPKHVLYASELVDRHPKQVFVLDHIAKPPIASGEIQPWASHLQQLASRPNVYCKVSGMLTEAARQTWRPEDLTPYFETVLEAFGPARLMFGSDWPVCLTGIPYAHWFNLVRSWIDRLSTAEQDMILGGTAMRAYRL